MPCGHMWYFFTELAILLVNCVVIIQNIGQNNVMKDALLNILPVAINVLNSVGKNVNQSAQN